MATQESHTSEPTLPEPSWAPLLLAVGIGAIYFTFMWRDALGGAPILAALLLFFGTLFYWVHEDAKWFKRDVSTGHRNPFHGTAYFIGTEIMFFGALFATYFYYMVSAREQGLDFGDHVTFPIGLITVNTAILFASGFTMHWAHNGVKKGNQNTLKIGLILTIILGAIFLGVQVREYLDLVEHGVKMFGEGSDLYGTTFYMLTGTHGSHVLGGLIYLGIVLWRSYKNQFTPERHAAVETAAIYWHFVDIVWVFVYAIVYLDIFRM